MQQTGCCRICGGWGYSHFPGFKESQRQDGYPLTGLPLREDQLLQLASDLKRRCGTGGSVKDGKIELQGDHREKAAAELRSLGYRVKLAGG
jgi:translation initiation factor 1 (eIF-1/SUI1)